MIKIILLLTCPFTVYANQPDSDLSGGLSSIVLFIGLFAIMYFVIIRPQTKKAKEHKTLIDTIKINDEIVTNSGIVGKIEKITEQFVIIEICNNTTIIIRKEFISTIIPKGTIKNIK